MSQDAIESSQIRAIDAHSVHKITSGQVVIDLQTAIKELVENSLDAAATNIEVRFKEYGLKSFEVIDNGTGVPKENYETLALKHHTSKLSKFEDLTTVRSFGFRGEALSSLCALAESVSFITATADETPMGTVLEVERSGKLKSCSGKAARQRGTTTIVTGLFASLPVRRKELERNIKREFGKALTLLNAYALVPCAQENKGVRFTVYNSTENGKRSQQLRTDGTPSIKASVSALWGPKSLDNLVPLDLTVNYEAEKSLLKRQGISERTTRVRVTGLISNFAPGCGRVGNDRQFFFVNGRPWNPSKVQKAINEVYRSFNSTQAPFIVADFQLPTDACDINASPDKRTIFLHSEANFILALKEALDSHFNPTRSTYTVNGVSPDATANATAIPKTQPNSTVKAPPQKPAVSPDTQIEETAASSSSKPLLETDLGEVRASDRSPARKPNTRPLFLESPSPEPVSSNSNVNATSLAQSSPTREASPPLTQVTSGIQHVISPIGPKAYTKRPSPNQDVAEPSKRPIQMVLSTAGASWNLQQSADDQAGPAVKRARLSDSISAFMIKNAKSAVASPVTARANLREQLSGFALPGSQPSSSAASVDEELPGGGDQLEEDQEEEDEIEGEDDDDDDDDEEDEDYEEGDKDEEAAHPSKDSTLSGFDPAGVSPKQPGRKEPRAARNPKRLLSLSSPVKPGSSLGADDDVFMTAGKGDFPEAPLEMAHGKGRQMEPENSTVEPIYENGEKLVGLPSRKGVGKHDDLHVVTRQEYDHAVSSSGAVRRSRNSVGGTILDEPPQKADPKRSAGEILRTRTDNEDCSLNFSLDAISQRWRAFATSRLPPNQPIHDKGSSCSPGDSKSVINTTAAGTCNTSNDGSAENELSRVVRKTDFEAMEVVGQFNKGFIVARRRKSGDGEEAVATADDLFLVDQHAADEKYNFETLQLTTKIQSQMLVRPRPLELSAADEVVAMEHVDMLRSNGFEISVDDNAPPGRGERLKLLAQPMSKGTVFDIKDLDELIHLLQDQPVGQVVRCSKARAMFASRACRKSVMVGHPLTIGQMTSIVRHMATIDQPWNCPHGRPTMRHLCSLVDIGPKPRVNSYSRPVDWKALSS